MNLKISTDALKKISTQKQKKRIIEIYANKICKLWDYYGEVVSEVSELHDAMELDDKEYSNRIIRIADETRNMLAVLCIEQFYNTGDESLFDRSLSMNEDITLSIISQINMNELEISEDNDRLMSKPSVFFYQGMFINIEDVSQPVFHEQHNEILVREQEVVNMINKKLNRARIILNVDDVTLGKKYYDGLCMRSHYM